MQNPIIEDFRPKKLNILFLLYTNNLETLEKSFKKFDKKLI